MGRIPQSFINDLLVRVDIVDIIDARVTLKKAGKNYQGLCPFHNEKTPSFSVSPDKQFYHCFGCGASGTALTFLMEFDRMEFVEAVETLARQVGVEVPREGGGNRPRQDHADLYQVLSQAERFFRKSLKAAPDAVEYLKGRGLSGEIARDFGIGYAPDAWDALTKALPEVPEGKLLEAGLLTRNDKGRVYDRFRGRVMFPIRDTRGRIIGFGGRILGGDGNGPKYLNSPETPVFHKGYELYGLYEARRALRRLDRLLVVEGYMDVVALAQAGIANAVATLGTSATPDHFRKLFRYTQEVVCCFDGDNAGRQAAWRALESALPVLGEGKQLKFMFLPEGEDPDSLVRAEGKVAFLARVDKAEPAIEYLFNRLSQGRDLTNLDDQAWLAAEVTPYIQKVPAGALKQLMASRLRNWTGYDLEEAPAPRTPVAARPAAKPNSALSALSQRLLSRLLQRPSVLLNLPAEARRALSDDEEPDLFVEVVRYVDQNPETETGEILGRWAGTAEHATLVKLLNQLLPLSEEAVQAEFSEGVERYLAGRRKARIGRKVDDMRREPTREKLVEYWTLKRGASGPDGAT